VSPGQFLRRGLRALVRRTVGQEARRARYFRAVARRGGRKGFLFVSGPGGEAARYRCRHQAEQLELVGETADVGYFAELDLESLVDHYDRFVLYRVPWDERLERFVERARERGKPVVADVDDLVFDPERAHLLHELSLLNGDARRQREDSIARLGQTLAAVDGVVVSTEPLRTAASRLNPRVVVAPNAVSAEMVEDGKRARAARRARPEVVVAYLSGTSTHDRDFLEAADAVVWALERYPHVQFWAVGFLSLDERFNAHGDRVVLLPFRPWQRLPELLAEIDVNLAPLQLDNEFTDAKSGLKYLEAALVGVPTLASATNDFRRVIDPEVNGLLATDPDEWRRALGRLVESEDLRRSLGEAARSDVLSHHTTAARAAETHNALLAAFGQGTGSGSRTC
jgi:glycosyltransferase involved in cell wall biosynthesis